MTTSVPTIDEIRDRVRQTLRDQVGGVLDRVADDDELRDALADRYDSIAALEFITRVEAAFDIEVDFVGHDVRYAFATIGRLSRYVQDQMEDRAVLGNGA